MEELLLKNIDFTLKNLQQNVFRVKKNEQGEIVYTFNEGPIPRKLNVCTDVVYGKSIRELVGDENAEEVMPYYKDAFQGKVTSYELSAGGFIFQTVLSPVDVDGKIVEVSGTSYDITEKRKQEQELADAHARLKVANDAKNKIISVIAHDLRAPFGSLSKLLDFSIEYLHDKNYDKVLKTMVMSKKAADKSFFLLENLFDWAKSQMNEVDISPKTIHLASLIRESIEVYQFQADLKKISIRFSCDEELDVFADENSLKAVFRNLISNAVKFSHENTSVGIEVTSQDENCVIAVRDQGVGMTKDKADSLFEYGANQSEFGTMGEKGAGLGLSLCAEFVRRNNGQISVQSEAGKGSVFFVTIPRSYSRQELLKNPDVKLLQNISVLVAEDEDINFLYIKEVLEKFNLLITRVKNGSEAVERCRDKDFDIVLMDNRMPVLDGVEACTQIRQFNSDILLVMHTSHCSREDQMHALEAGCNEFIEKPLSPEKMIDLLNKYMAK